GGDGVAWSTQPAPIIGQVIPGRTHLQEVGAEVAAYYCQMEGQLLWALVSKAIAMDEVVPSAPASSSAEDAFYVAQRCAKRGLATGHAGCASAVVNHVGNTLGGDYLDAIVKKVKSSLSTLPAGGSGTLDLTMKQLGQIDFTDLASIKNQLQMDNWEGMGAGLASDLTSSASAAISTIRRSTQGQGSGGAVGGIVGGGGGVGAPGVKGANAGGVVGVAGAGAGGAGQGGAGARIPRSECLVFVNTLGACAEYVVQLRGVLERDATDAFEGAVHDQEMVVSCLQGLEATGEQFSRAASDCLEEVVNRLRPVIRTMLASRLGEKSCVTYRLTETQYAANEAEDPFAHALIDYLGMLLQPYHPPAGLSEGLHLELLTLVAQYLAKRLELALKRRTFTQLGGLQLDKDLRCIMGFFTQQAGRGAREPFARLAQANPPPTLTWEGPTPLTFDCILGMALLLNLDRPQSVADYWEAGTALKAQLTAEE
ncbi:unnamed protein product, partial [Discosporangium mesarthrocarpum]